MSYNGHKNWETWVVRLHMEEQLFQETEEWLEHNSKLTENEMESYLKDFVTDFLHDQSTEIDGLLGDIIGGVLDEVDWREIAVDMVGEIKSQWS